MTLCDPMDCIIPCFSVLLFESGGQSIWASASVLPMKIQGLFPLGFTGLISLLSKGLSTFFSSTTVWKHQFFITQPSLSSNSHIRTWLLENDFDYTNIFDYAKLMSLLFNMLSRFVIAFVPKGKHLLISWLQSLSAVILEPKKIKSACFHCFPFYLPWSDGARCYDPNPLSVKSQANFFTLLFHPHQEVFSFLFTFCH